MADWCGHDYRWTSWRFWWKSKIEWHRPHFYAAKITGNEIIRKSRFVTWCNKTAFVIFYLLKFPRWFFLQTAMQHRLPVQTHHVCPIESWYLVPQKMATLWFFVSGISNLLLWNMIQEIHSESHCCSICNFGRIRKMPQKSLLESIHWSHFHCQVIKSHWIGSIVNWTSFQN